MEMIVFENNQVNSYVSIDAIEIAELSDKVRMAPEDYAWLLSPKEFQEWYKLHQSLLSQAKGITNVERKMAILGDFVKQHTNNPLSVISYLSGDPIIGGTHKIAVKTDEALGSYYVVFFTKSGQENERAKGIVEEIRRSRWKSPRGPSLS